MFETTRLPLLLFGLILCSAAAAEELGFAYAEHDQGYEFEHEGCSVEDEVDGDEALEGEAECEGPSKAAG